MSSHGDLNIVRNGEAHRRPGAARTQLGKHGMIMRKRSQHRKGAVLRRVEGFVAAAGGYPE